jgi:hypothetical protein
MKCVTHAVIVILRAKFILAIYPLQWFNPEPKSGTLKRQLKDPRSSGIDRDNRPSWAKALLISIALFRGFKPPAPSEISGLQLRAKG